MIPATRATPRTSPFATVPAVRCSIISEPTWIAPVAMAVLCVTGLSETSTITALPFSSKWVNLFSIAFSFITILIIFFIFDSIIPGTKINLLPLALLFWIMLYFIPQKFFFKHVLANLRSCRHVLLRADNTYISVSILCAENHSLTKNSRKFSWF